MKAEFFPKQKYSLKKNATQAGVGLLEFSDRSGFSINQSVFSADICFLVKINVNILYHLELPKIKF